MDIKNISGINEVNRVAKAEKAKNASRTEKTDRADSIELSNEAKRSTEIKKYIDIVKSAPDIRTDKVKSAKEKLENGEYDNIDIYAKLAENLKRKFEIEDKILKDLEEKS
ncbi:MAG: flagellar biosynthesis anti-sigma factor FlgM [bacterium]|nr:flagellar biosynthesis anti-sigma factor FlgM [bacterium]